ncbi:hypothetical protein KCU95_g15843, partial [Aureobasidium melanogenum]
MKGDRLSVFIEANRFPPAINQHHYSVLRAEADAIAEQLLIIASNNNNNNKVARASQLYEGPDMNRSSSLSVYELEANELSAGDSSSSLHSIELPVLPRISMLSAFNPFAEAMLSSPSPVADLLQSAVKNGSMPTTTLSSSEPPTDYLASIAPTAPFGPYKEKYEDHPAGIYGAQRFKNRQTISSAPFGFETQATSSFVDRSSASFTQFCDASSSVSNDVVAKSPCSSQSSYSHHRKPLSRPSKVPRKPLPLGAEQFPPVSCTPPNPPERLLTSCGSYTPPGSPFYHASLRDNTGTKIVSPVPKHPSRSLLDISPIRSPLSKHRVGAIPGPNLHKPLHPSPFSASSLTSSDYGMHPRPSHSPNIIPGPVTAAGRVRSNLRDAKDRFLDKLSKASRF